MTLAPGTRLGPYEISAPIGAGGMGEVYRARDTRLDRSVAIKVLPPHLAESEERRARFEREARAVSSLNHPHICVLHDVGRQDGIDYLVMELLEGSSLADRLRKGPLPLAQALRIGAELADAIAKAHRHGVVHRDLKPGNVMLTTSGAKLLDFGLAKHSTEPGGASPVSTLATATVGKPLTETGKLLGTFQYMAPEQVEGKEADARTDIFALGSVLYEMVAGQPAFEGKSQASLIAAILGKDPPPLSSLQPLSPKALDHVLRICLAKDPEDRWQSAEDLRHALQWVASGEASQVAEGLLHPRPLGRERAAWLAVAATAALLTWLVARRAPDVPAPKPLVRFSIAPSEKLSLGSAVTVSPDGTQLAYTALDEANNVRLFVRPLDALSARPLPDTVGARFPFWSPDSRVLGFFAGDGKLKKIHVVGGQPEILADYSDPRGGAWGENGEIVFAPNFVGPLQRASARGGPVSPATRIDKQRYETSHRWPSFLPDGKRFVFLARSGIPNREGYRLGRLGSAASESVAPGISSVASADRDLLLLVQGRSLVARRFDAEHNRLAEARVIAEGVGAASGVGYAGWAAFGASRNGVLAYREVDQSASVLSTVDRSGRSRLLSTFVDSQGEPALSPDGRLLAVALSDAITGTGDLWLLELATGARSRLSFSEGTGTVYSPVFSPDGRWIAYSRVSEGSANIFRKPVSGAGPEELLYKSDHMKFPDAWSPDGRVLLFESNDPGSRERLVGLDMAGGSGVASLPGSAGSSMHATFSPSGRHLAYTSDSGGTLQVYVESYPPTGARWQVSTHGGDQAQWRRDGKELFFVAADGSLVAVPVRSGRTFEAGAPVVLFNTNAVEMVPNGGRNTYAPAADGQGFYMITAPESASKQPIQIILGWESLLDR